MQGSFRHFCARVKHPPPVVRHRIIKWNDTTLSARARIRRLHLRSPFRSNGGWEEDTVVVVISFI